MATIGDSLPWLRAKPSIGPRTLLDEKRKDAIRWRLPDETPPIGIARTC
ncbi:MAG: hypothetical protein R3C49_01605 [Planctomycetaceae bacterium]